MRRFILFLSWFVALSTVVFGQDYLGYKHPDTKKMNYGIKAGFNSSMYIASDFRINNVAPGDVQNNYRIGYTFSGFSRFNIGKHFIQPEVSYSISRCEIVFDKSGTNHPDIEPDYAYVRSKIHCIGFPLLYGYNIVRKESCSMSFFFGPQLRYFRKRGNETSFENFDQKDIQEELYPFNAAALAGVAVSIWPVFFDFRYEQGLSNVSRSVTYSYQSSDNRLREAKISLPRKDHVLSFSLGIMF